MRQDVRIIVIGLARSGKSTLAFGGDPLPFGLVDVAKRQRTFVFDTAKACPRGGEFHTDARLVEYLRAERDGVPDAVNFMQGQEHIYCLRPRSDEALQGMLRLFAEHGVAGTIIIDEIDDTDFAPAVGKVNPLLQRIVKYGGNYGQDMIGIGRRWTSIHRDVRTQVDAVITYRQPNKSEASRIVSELNIDASGEQLMELGNHEFTILSIRPVPMLEKLKHLRSYVEVQKQE